MKRLKRKKNKLILLILSLLSILILFSFYIAYDLTRATNNNQETTIKVKGDIKETLALLEANNLIKNKEFANIYVKLFKRELKFYEGNFKVPSNLTLNETLAYLSNKANILKEETVKITFIEGDWAKHMARKLAQNTNLKYQDIINYWNDPNVFLQLSQKYTFLKPAMIQRKPKLLMEGYLMPNTYEFYVETNIQTVTEKILDQTQVIFDKYQADFKKSGMSIIDVFTLASIVQYESGSVSEMPKIAQVFYNRLERGMRLESSVTRCYVLNQEKDDNWRNCEVNLDFFDPYDTYQVSGLPPGPILNPSEDAIKATLNPEKHDYLFFVGDLNGTSYFAKTLAEHEQNICKYLLKNC